MKRAACFLVLCAIATAACTRIVDLTPRRDASIIDDGGIPPDGGPGSDAFPLNDALPLGDAFHVD
jgi:hypothetical protein